MAEVRALTIRQPWAWLVAHGVKQIENRTWSTDYRGTLLIHAAKLPDDDGYRSAQSTPKRLRQAQTAGLPGLPELLRTGQLGAIVGVATLDYVLPPESREQIIHPKPVWWDEGCYGWCVGGAVALNTPIPCNGRLGLWRPDEELLLRVCEDPAVAKVMAHA